MSPTQTTLVQVLPLAAKDLDENKVTPGVLGFIVFAVMGMAVWMLMKSMNKHMKRVDFEEKPTSSASGASDGAPAASEARREAAEEPVKKESAAEPAAEKEPAASAASAAPKPKTTG
ncbi:MULTISPECIES: hypothetical protein [unclassified Streptomyces]|uniref:hypothetical protein n=1 Tax=unclassified Streptomyces TaxID=2593676 RepID=UPI002DD8AD89|nr:MULTISPECIES: hypothetical protein [unclassified Streptomyces]WSA92723.1 hypothetical protein OIE63_14980 [Streptomyces sp. NBC_01795]WSB77094.1 hypothetical protein OHB04_15815 [Streptomyces sp. NBC_01775]WSS14639.1 hypothetical protein OG533_24160 [Streptomyces sp. NBC_01186]WSS43453.1 hypothetical protein OG220_24830 [Streptomyces sp. NBC_01187]